MKAYKAYSIFKLFDLIWFLLLENKFFRFVAIQNRDQQFVLCEITQNPNKSYFLETKWLETDRAIKKHFVRIFFSFAIEFSSSLNRSRTKMFCAPKRSEWIALKFKWKYKFASAVSNRKCWVHVCGYPLTKITWVGYSS